MSVQITKQSISIAFFKLLESKPYEKITVSDVTDTAGVNRMTFYYHFKDIEDLVFKTVEGVFLDICKKAIDEGNPASAYINVYLTAEKHKDLVKQIYPSIDIRRIIAFFSPLAYKLAIYLINVKAGKRIPREKKEFFAHTVASCMIGSFIEWLGEDMEKDPRELIKGQNELFEVALNALCQK